MMLKCIRRPRENQLSPQPFDDQYHSIWEHDGLKIYVVALSMVTLDIEYAWIAMDERHMPVGGVEIMRGKFKIDRGFAMSHNIRPGEKGWIEHWYDQFRDSIAMLEFAHFMGKLASKYYGKEVKYEQEI